MNFARLRPGKVNRLKSNDINYHYATYKSLREARNIINKSRRNARIPRLSASYKSFLFLILRINLRQKFYLHWVYP
jgi:hypothetical protein